MQNILAQVLIIHETDLIFAVHWLCDGYSLVAYPNYSTSTATFATSLAHPSLVHLKQRVPTKRMMLVDISVPLLSQYLVKKMVASASVV